MSGPDDLPPGERPGSIRPGVRRVFVLDVPSATRTEDEIDEEIQLHLEARIAKLVDQGWSADAARAEAERRFGAGGDQRVKQSAQTRRRRMRWSDRLAQVSGDIGYAARGLRRSPSFTIGVLLTLALGLGINSAVFRIADRLFLRPPAAVRDPGRIRRVIFAVPSRAGALSERQGFPYPTALLLSTARAFEHTAVYTLPVVQRADDGLSITTSTIGGGYMEMLGITPAIGRFFTPDELRPLSGIPSIVISSRFWQRQLGSDPAVLDRRIMIKGTSYRIVGVAAHDFVGVDLDPVDAWIPLGIGRFGHSEINGVEIPWNESTGLLAVRVLARLRPGISDQVAMASATASVAGPGPSDSQRTSLNVPARLRREQVRLGALSAPDGNDKAYVTSLRILGRFTMVAALILVMAVANTANLLLARALRRRREIAVRLALGISRSRLIAQLTSEGALIGLCAAAIAWLAGFWASAALRALLFPRGRWLDSVFDLRAAGFTVGLSLLLGAVAGLVPALQASRPELTSALSGNINSGRSGRRLRDGLVVAQTGLSATLLISAGLFVQSLRQLTAVDLGIAPDGLITAAIPVDAALRTGAPVPGARNSTSVEELVAQVRALPGVRAVALASITPFDAVEAGSFDIPGQDSLPDLDGGGPYITGINPDYFTVMHTRVLDGRGILASDDASAPRVVVINTTMAATYWPGQRAVGKCFKIGGGSRPCSEIVGVVQDIRDKPDGLAIARYYVSLPQMTPARIASALIVRTAPAMTSQDAAALLRTTFLGAPLRIDAVADRVTSALRPWRIGTLMFTALGVLALLLATVGLSSTLLYTFSQRQREIGVRLALGASATSVVMLVVQSGARLVAAGFVLGALCAFAGSRAMAAVSFHTSLGDPVVYAGAAAAMACATIIAAAWPALRVRAVHPAEVLRNE